MVTGHVTPYNTGKIKIGCMYAPPKRLAALDSDATRLQSALLNTPVPWYRRVMFWLLGV